MTATTDIVLRDASALRALAHADRLAILDRLHERGPATATEVAAHVGISPSAASYHLRTLARFGLVEDTGDGTGRNRPWRAVGSGFRFEPAEHASPAAAAAAQLLGAELVMRGEQEALDFIGREPELAPEWRAASSIANKTLWLTADEAAEVARRIDEVVEPYLRSARVEMPDGGRAASLLLRLFPRG